MKGKDGKNLNIIRKIANEYQSFGIELLKDDNGDNVEAIRSNHINKGVEAIATAILQEWLNDGGPTCTYTYLIECIRAVRLGALAEEIRLAITKRTTGGGKSVHCTCTQPESIIS